MRGIVYLAALFALTCAVGCYLPLKAPEGYSTKLQDQFNDIPIPYEGGYEYLESDSFTYVAPGSESLRVAKIKVIGDTRVDEMVEFYKHQMQIHGFNLVDENPSKAVHKVTLTFVKKGENEECVIEIERKGTDIHILLKLRPA
jgi:hypothetical protein